jgi:hypothetical protein
MKDKRNIKLGSPETNDINLRIEEHNKKQLNTESQIKKKQKEIDIIVKEIEYQTRNKNRMEQWKPANRVLYEFDYDGYNPEKIIEKLPKNQIGKQLEWIINERSATMKKVNETRGNPIRRVYFDLILDDSADKVFVRCAWEIHTSSKEDKDGYYEYYTHSHFVEEFKIRDDSDEPLKFQTQETQARIKAKAEKEEEAKTRNETKVDYINGHRITYKAKRSNGTYTNLYYTDDVKKIDDTDIVEIKKEGYGYTTIWKDEAVASLSYSINIIIQINRIDEVAKRVYYNIVGFLGRSKEDFNTKLFIPYEDKKEREAKTLIKDGILKLPFANLSSEEKIPAFKVKTAEVVKPAEGAGDGKHHFEINGFKATSKDDKKASLKKAVYDDIVYLTFRKHYFKDSPDYAPKITGFTEEEHNKLAKVELRTTDKGESYPVEKMSYNFIAKWTDFSKGQARIIGYVQYPYTYSEKAKIAIPYQNLIVQFPYKKASKKYTDYDKIFVDMLDTSALVGTF